MWSIHETNGGSQSAQYWLSSSVSRVLYNTLESLQKVVNIRLHASDVVSELDSVVLIIVILWVTVTVPLVGENYSSVRDSVQVVIVTRLQATVLRVTVIEVSSTVEKCLIHDVVKELLVDVVAVGVKV